MAESVEQRILDNVVSTLQGITTGAGYQQTVKQVYVFEGNALDAPEIPCAVVLHERTERSAVAPRAPNGVVTCFLHLLVWASIEKEPTTWKRDIGRLASDIDKALRVDWTRGALAFDTHVDEVKVANEGDGFPVPVAQLAVRIHFRTAYEDSTAAA